MRILIISFFLMLTLTSIKAQTTTTISGARISFIFLAKDVNGTIAGFDSDATIDLENPSNSKFKGSVAVETLKTGISLRNWHLKGKKYFNEKKYPRIFFESSQVEKNEGNIRVRGKLMIKGITKTITIVFKKKGNQLVGTTSLYCSDYGINIKKKREDNKVKIKIVLDLK
ncbi:MAG: YceI family protein [Bacteroidota bacterium]